MRPGGKRSTGWGLGPQPGPRTGSGGSNATAEGRRGKQPSGRLSEIAGTNRGLRATGRESNGNPERAVRLTRGWSFRAWGRPRSSTSRSSRSAGRPLGHRYRRSNPDPYRRRFHSYHLRAAGRDQAANRGEPLATLACTPLGEAYAAAHAGLPAPVVDALRAGGSHLPTSRDRVGQSR